MASRKHLLLDFRRAQIQTAVLNSHTAFAAPTAPQLPGGKQCTYDAAANMRAAAGTAEGHGTASFAMLRELPPRPTQRTCKISTDLKNASAVLDAAVFEGATDEQQQQLNLCQNALLSISKTLKELKCHQQTPVFNQLQQWAAASGQLQHEQTCAKIVSDPNGHSVPSQTAAMLSTKLPIVALSVASCTHSAGMYAYLIVSLKQKGHPVASISARETAAGISSVVSSAMRQYHAASTAADDIPALLAWWQDQWQQAYGGNPAAGSGAVGSSMHAPGSSAAAVVAAATGASAATAGRRAATPVDGLQSPAPLAVLARTPNAKTTAGSAVAATTRTTTRQLRARTALASDNGLTAAATKLQVPVLILQEADSGDMEALEELVIALSEARAAGLPLVLVLGISSSQAGLLQLLPNSMLRRTQLLQLSLPLARVQLTQMYRACLLAAPQPQLVLGPCTSLWLLRHFRDADCSASMAERVLQLACIEHYRQQPLSCLAAAAARGRRKELTAAVAQLSQAQMRRCCQALLTHPSAQDSSVQATQKLQALDDSCRPAAGGASAAASTLESAVWGGMQSFGKWRLGLLLLYAAASFTGATEVDASLQLPSLYAAASQATFLQAKKRGMLSQCGRLLLKVLGDCQEGSAAARGVSNRTGCTTVAALSEADCSALLGKLLHLLAQGKHNQQWNKEKEQRRSSWGVRSGKQQGADGVDSDSSGSDGDGSGSDGDSSGSANDSDAGTDSDVGGEAAATALAAPGGDSEVLFSCVEVQQLQVALITLQSAAASAFGKGDIAGKTAAGAATSPPKYRKPEQQQQQQQPEQGHPQPAGAALLQRVLQQFEQLLTPLPEQVEVPAAAAAMNDYSTPVTAAINAQTPARKGASRADAALTPKGLASALRKKVRFAAADTPDILQAKQAARNSARSTPDDGNAAVAGHIRTPNRGATPSMQTRKQLFDSTRAASAALPASAAKPGRKRASKKQAPETGEIAGSSAAALAAVAAAAETISKDGPKQAGAAVPANKRSQRLLGIMTAANQAGSPGSNGAGLTQGKNSVGLPSAPSTTSYRLSADGQNLSETAKQQEGSSAAAHSTMSAAAAGAAGAGDGGAEMLTTPVKGARGSSRLSKQSAPPQDEQQQGQQLEAQTEAAAFAPAAQNAVRDLAVHGSNRDDSAQAGQGQQQQQQQRQQGPQAASVLSCGMVLAKLLEAVIPKLLIHWTQISSSNSGSNSGSLGAASGTVGSSRRSSSSISPLAAAGAAAFTFDSVNVLDSLLAAAPRYALHAALTAPSEKLSGHPKQLGPGWEDTCLAYVLLQQQREDSITVSDWFNLFAQAQGVQGLSSNNSTVNPADVSDGDVECADGALGGMGRAARARARVGRKARGYAEARGATAAGGNDEDAGIDSENDAETGSAKASGKSSSNRSRGSSSSRSRRDQRDRQTTPRGSSKKGTPGAQTDNSTASVAVDQEQLLQVAARFSQAASELQLLGVWRPTKRRRVAAVLRSFAPEGPNLQLQSDDDAGNGPESLADMEY